MLKPLHGQHVLGNGGTLPSAGRPFRKYGPVNVETFTWSECSSEW